MSPRPPIFTLLWVLAAVTGAPQAAAQAPSDGPPKEPSGAVSSALGQTSEDVTEVDAGSLLKRAIAAMDARNSIVAKTSHQVDLFGRPPLFGKGTYMERQSAKGRLFRLDLTLMLEDQQISTVVEVFDGHCLWKYEDLDGKKLVRVDVDRVNKTLAERGQVPEEGAIGQRPGLGGLSRVLRGLDAAFNFATAEPTAFLSVEQSPERQLPAWKLRGTWRPEKLVKILPDQADNISAGKPASLDKLPQQLPDHVLLYLGKEDLFPYQIDYRRAGGKGLFHRDRSEGRSILTMRFTEVDFNRHLQDSQFNYNPGKDDPDNLTPTDGTEAFLKHLERGSRKKK